MNSIFINTFIKTFGITLSLSYIYIKVTQLKSCNLLKNLFIFTFSILVSIMVTCFKKIFPGFTLWISVFVLYSIFFTLLTHYKFSSCLIITIISASLSYITLLISTLIWTIIFLIFNFDTFNNTILLLLISILQFITVHYFFRIKRFKNGFPFLNNKDYNNYFDLFILIASFIVIITCFLLGNYKILSRDIIFISLVCSSIILIPIIRRIFILYQKQKLIYNTLKDCEQELQDTKQKLQTALEEKQKLIKSNHEFYHRQEALRKKLDDLIKQTSSSFNTEFGEDYGNLLDRINKLSDEYSAKTYTQPKLTKTNIIEIDDMLSYMQSECTKNNIEFILKIDCNIQHMINNLIPQNQLETLLGDLIRNAIIAINHSSNTYKSIMVVFGIKDESYELCVFDSGIPFEIDTLLNLGLKPASTHESEGGTGIGFITTFETINSCNASLIINEITHNNYTKSIEIKFDNKQEYIIISDRYENINNINNSKRNIIIKG